MVIYQATSNQKIEVKELQTVQLNRQQLQVLVGKLASNQSSHRMDSLTKELQKQSTILGSTYIK